MLQDGANAIGGLAKETDFKNPLIKVALGLPHCERAHRILVILGLLRTS